MSVLWGIWAGAVFVALLHVCFHSVRFASPPVFASLSHPDTVRLCRRKLVGNVEALTQLALLADRLDVNIVRMNSRNRQMEDVSEDVSFEAGLTTN